jgi:hypothetical protein
MKASPRRVVAGADDLLEVGAHGLGESWRRRRGPGRCRTATPRRQKSPRCRQSARPFPPPAPSAHGGPPWRRRQSHRRRCPAPPGRSCCCCSVAMASDLQRRHAHEGAKVAELGEGHFRAGLDPQPCRGRFSSGVISGAVTTSATRVSGAGYPAGRRTAAARRGCRADRRGVDHQVESSSPLNWC